MPRGVRKNLGVAMTDILPDGPSPLFDPTQTVGAIAMPFVQAPADG